MRLIDEDMLIRKYINTDIKKFSNSDVKIVLENLKQNILKAPSIDICFCRECRHWDNCKNTMHNHRCIRAAKEHNLDYWTGPDDFCAWGERNSDEKK